jgi:hypothetical protein
VPAQPARPLAATDQGSRPCGRASADPPAVRRRRVHRRGRRAALGGPRRHPGRASVRPARH